MVWKLYTFSYYVFHLHLSLIFCRTVFGYYISQSKYFPSSSLAHLPISYRNSFQHFSKYDHSTKFIRNSHNLKSSSIPIEYHSDAHQIPKAFESIKNFIQLPFKTISNIKHFFQTQLPMLQYVWPRDNVRLKVYLILAMLFMFLGKWFNLKVPFILQRTIDIISNQSTTSQPMIANSIVSTAGLAVIYYGISRAMSVVCSEIKTCLFAHVSQNVLRKFANEIFGHLHSLDSEFHLQTPSGVISVAYVRAIRGFQTMLFQIVFSVFPTLLELVMVSNVLYRRFGSIFAILTLATFSSYMAFTIWVTQWRVEIRQELVDVDNARNGFFIDSVLNHEVVKLFTNEKREQQKFDNYLQRIQQLSIDSTYAIAVLNLGQAALFCLGLTGSLFIALNKVQAGFMSVGDVVAVNSMLLQLSVPFNFVGYTYQELRQSFVDMKYMREILTERVTTIIDPPSAPSLDTLAPRNGPSTIEFQNVTFQYVMNNNTSNPFRNTSISSHGLESHHQPPVLLRNISLKVNRGESVAIVGPSGSGKSTTLKLMTRMLAPSSGRILMDGVDINTVSIESLRQRVAVVPQDTCLFDETIDYNLRYGRPHATPNEIEDAIIKSNLVDTIAKLPLGLNTSVGERGARLSGGERQKVSIARATLKNPSLILCDEVTSSVDAFAERDIVDTLRQAAANRTTITIAHRLSSIVNSDRIIVLDAGQIAEQGTHEELLAKENGVYHKMWEAQNGNTRRSGSVHPQKESQYGVVVSNIQGKQGGIHLNSESVVDGISTFKTVTYINDYVDDDEENETIICRVDPLTGRFVCVDEFNNETLVPIELDRRRVDDSCLTLSPDALDSASRDYKIVRRKFKKWNS